MLNEILKKVQTDNVEIYDSNVHVGNTGMPATDSANLGIRRQAQARTQRMRRRHQRAMSSFSRPLGWTARMA